MVEETAHSNTGTSAVGEQDFVALAPGRRIGRYEILSVLGQGGFGITYLARDEQLHREVAIKEYLPSALAVRQDGVTVLPRSTKVAEDFGWGRQRFVDEGRTLATLQRAPAIVRVFDFLEANGTAYIVMEMVPGETLESRLKNGRLAPAEIDRILWPLLDGLEQVHATGFLHRDIKPANILLDAAGNPTLIDFGASRVAIAGRSSMMTAIFTPGYAAAEQMTSARQGPWTDIYGLAATLYHAITGAAPPSAFDRVLDDEYRPLGQLQPPGFAAGLLAGLDAGLAVRAGDRPQSIAGWRPILGLSSMSDAQATVALPRAADANATIVVRQPTGGPDLSPTLPPARRGIGLWLGLAAVIVLALAGGGYWFAHRPPAIDEAALAAAQAATQAAAQAKAEAAARAQAAEAARVKQEEDEIARLRAEKAERDQEAHDAEVKRQAEEEARQKLLAEQAAQEAARQAAEAEAKAKAAAEEAAREKALAFDKVHAAEVEAALHLSPLDRQHAQVALTALGFSTNGTDGVFGQHTHDVIAAWQKSRAYPDTGYLTGAQNQELLRMASAAVAKFDDDQKKAEEAKAKAAAAAPAVPAPVVPAPQQAAAAPAGPVASGSPDGAWTGTYQCSPSRGGGPFTIPIRMVIRGGQGTYTVPTSTATSPGNHSIALAVTGGSVMIRRTYISTAGVNVGKLIVASMSARFEGGTITGSALEADSGGRNCTIILTR